MSRNLGITSCHYCSGIVKLEEAPRPITREEAGVYYELRDGYSYEGMITANAKCEDCNAKYLAWIDLSACPGYRPYHTRDRHSETIAERGFFDLSFRASFDDEPGVEDGPDFVITRKTVIDSRLPWPLCEKCGSKKLYQTYCPTCLDNEQKARVSHILKIWPDPFKAVRSKQKFFEVRCNDRGFKVNDTVRLEEWDPVAHRYTGAYEGPFRIAYVVAGGTHGLPKDICIFGWGSQ